MAISALFFFAYWIEKLISKGQNTSAWTNWHELPISILNFLVSIHVYFATQFMWQTENTDFQTNWGWFVEWKRIVESLEE